MIILVGLSLPMPEINDEVQQGFLKLAEFCPIRQQRIR
jgi:hypothetical protein